MGQPEYEQKKMCPLKHIGTCLLKGGGGVTDETCVEDYCAWWNEAQKKCAVLDISHTLLVTALSLARPLIRNV